MNETARRQSPKKRGRQATPPGGLKLAAAAKLFAVASLLKADQTSFQPVWKLVCFVKISIDGPTESV
jgi:hypothetical protein